MPESGEWFSPRTRPEMLTSDDPPIQDDKRAPVRILPGPATPVGRATAPLRRLVAVVPGIGRRIVRVDDEPSRWQLVGMWTTGSAIVAATGLAVAAVLGGAPPALTQPFERLSVLPGIVGERSEPDSVTSADKADGGPADPAGPSSDGRERLSDGASQSYTGGYSGGSGSVTYPEDLLPGRPIVRSSGGTSGSSAGGPSSPGRPAPPATGGTGSAAPSDPTTAPPDDPPPPVTDPTESPTDPAPPDDPAPPTEDPTDPAPPDDPQPPADPTPESPPDTPPADPPAADPPADPGAADPPADPGAADPPAQDQPVDIPPTGPTPTP
jgi:hypothetical protein